MLISIIIAVYRNEGTIAATHNAIREIFQNSLTSHSYQVIFIDDGSDDGSLAEIKAVAKIDPNVAYVSFTRNFGQMAAILSGLDKARGDAVINISADLQDPVDLMTEMIQKWESGAEIVIAYRQNREDTFSSRTLSRAAYSILRLSEPKLPPGGFDYVLIDRKPLDVFNSIPAKNRFFQGDLLWTGHTLAFIPYTRTSRTVGKSGYNFSKKLRNFIDALVDSSYLPIRCMSVMGIFTAFLGFLYSGTIVFEWFKGGTPFEGWAPIMMILLLTSGLIMTMLGVIGEYIWRINDELKGKPTCIIREQSPDL